MHSLLSLLCFHELNLCLESSFLQNSLLPGYICEVLVGPCNQVQMCLYTALHVTYMVMGSILTTALSLVVKRPKTQSRIAIGLTASSFEAVETAKLQYAPTSLTGLPYMHGQPDRRGRRPRRLHQAASALQMQSTNLKGWHCSFN